MKKIKLLIIGLLLAGIALAGVGTVTATNNSTVRFMDRNYTSSAFTTQTTLVPAWNVSRADNWTVWVKNTSGAQAFSDLAILVSPEDANWDDAKDLVGSAFNNVVVNGCVDTLAADTLCSIQCFNCSYKFVSVKVTAGANATAAAWLQGRVAP